MVLVFGQTIIHEEPGQKLTLCHDCPYGKPHKIVAINGREFVMKSCTYPPFHYAYCASNLYQCGLKLPTL